MKGQAALLIIVLIVVGIVALFYFSGSSGFSLASLGFTGQGIVYSNDVIQVTDKLVSDNQPYDGETTSIEFTVKNAGKGPIDGKNGRGPVEVSLEPPTGFTSIMKCGDKPSCKFTMDEGEAVDVTISLTAQKGVTQIIPVDVRYSVKFPYSGEREAHIPIVKDKNSLPKGQSFFVGDSTYGPIQVSVTPPDSRTTPNGGSAIYAVDNPSVTTPVKMQFSVSNVGNGGAGLVRPVFMQGDDLKLVLRNLAIQHCDKIDENTGALKVQVSGSGSSTQVSDSTSGSQTQDQNSASPPTVPTTQQSSSSQTPTIGQKVPFDVTCTFLPKAASDFTDGVMGFQYKYTYEISFLDQFEILPTNVPKIQNPTGQTSTGQQPPTIQTSGSSNPVSPPTSGTGTGSGGVTGGTPTEIKLSTDKSSYSASQTVSISGSLSPAASGASVTGEVLRPNGDCCEHIFQVVTDSSGAFTHSFTLPSNPDKGTWTIRATYNGMSSDKTITVA